MNKRYGIRLKCVECEVMTDVAVIRFIAALIEQFLFLFLFHLMGVKVNRASSQ